MPKLSTIPGFTALQALTLGDPRIKIAVLDGHADLDRACFQGANISRVKPFWQPDLEPIDPFYIQQELKVKKLGDQKKALKKTKKELENQKIDLTTSQADNNDEANDEAIKPSVAYVAPSGSGQLLSVTKTVFNALLKPKDAPSLEQFHQLKASQQQTILKPEPPVIINPTIDTALSVQALEAEIEALEAEIKTLQESIPKPVQERLVGIFHATGIFGTMFGQPGSPVEGVAPYCTVINIPLFETASSEEALSPLNIAHAFNLAMELGVNIIHCAACHPTQTGFAHEMIQKAVKQCQDNNILIVAPSGNNKGEWFCVPAILPNVLAVGMMKDNGQPANYSNWGGQYQKQGILAPGENIPAAQPGTDEPTLQEGTSLSAPFVSGISALLMSLQLQRGESPNAEAVRTALLNSAIPCDPEEVAEPERCLVGKLNISGAFQLLTGEWLSTELPEATETPQKPLVQPSIHSSSSLSFSSSPQPIQIAESSTFSEGGIAIATATNTNLDDSNLFLADSSISVTTSTITPSALTNKVYALGTLGYDFGSEARRDTFKQGMPDINFDGVLVPANPYDARQMVDYLDQVPAEGKSLIWTLNQELTPIYALEPQKAFASDTYAVFQMLLAGQIQPESSDDYIERISIPGLLSDRTVELFSGQVVPVLTLPNVRGIYGWQVNTLVEAAITTTSHETSPSDQSKMRRALSSFLKRVYYDLRNLGRLDRDRALNFAATNAFQAASTFADAIASGMELDTIEVEKSPFCRLDSNCWDVKLKFYDPENGRRAKKIFRFTIDVKDTVPVTLGTVRSWSVPR